MNLPNGYEKDERIVYDDGYDATNATEFEGINFPGVTNRDLAWKFGRYHIAQARLRPETYKFNADFEHLSCARGDLIRVSHDVPLWGGGSGRVKELVTYGDDTLGVKLDNQIIMEAGKNYVCRFRLEDGASLLLPVITQAGETATLTFENAILMTNGPMVGDLAMFGEVGKESVELLVKAIRRGADLEAEIECVDYAPEIYQADQGEIPAFTPNVTKPVEVDHIDPAVPIIANIETGTAALIKDVNGIKTRVLVDVMATHSSIRVEKNKLRYKLQEASSWQYMEQLPEQTQFVITDVIDGEMYQIQVAAISIYGKQSVWSETRNVTVIGQRERPTTVQNYVVTANNGNLYHGYSANSEIDIKGYRIRWSPLLSGAVWNGAVDVVTLATGTTAVTPARSGTYLIKAVDLSGNESEEAAAVVTSSPDLQGFNFVEKIEAQGIAWAGTGDGADVSLELGGLVLTGDGNLWDADDLYAIPNLHLYGGLKTKGRFTLSNILDLEDKFTVRASASLEVESVDYAVDLWDVFDLWALDNLSGVGDGDISASLLIRTTDDDPSGDPVWSAFMPFVVGDYTARAFQMAVDLESKVATATPVIKKATMTIDMQDRPVGFDEVIPAEGARITFDPAFYAIPKLGISILNGQEGDRFEITNETEDGFDIQALNAGLGISRRISGSAISYGERRV